MYHDNPVLEASLLIHVSNSLHLPRLIKYEKATVDTTLTASKKTQQQFYSQTTQRQGTHPCVPCTYFDKDKALRARQRAIRNVAVIAHVDHGKTTLSDALLHKAGLLHKDRVGDQSKGRSLDTLKDEKERGITIKSAAITLDLSVKESVLKDGPYAAERKQEAEHMEARSAEANEADALPTDIYMGNLPRDFTLEDLQDLLAEKSIPVNTSSIRFSGRRSYAIVTVEGRYISGILALNASSAKGSQLVVQVAGENPILILKEMCQSHDVQMPELAVLEENHLQFTGKATWSSLGGVIIQAPGFYKTQKEARQAVAQECIDFLQRQRQDHVHLQNVEQIIFDAPPEERDDKSVTSSASTSEGGRVPLIINLVDTPGHIEFNAEVTAALRVSDGALVVVDAVEGKAVQTEEVLRQALREGVKPVLMINKVDRLFIDKQLSAEEVYDAMKQVVRDVNDFIVTHQLKTFPDQRVKLVDGSVCFGSGYFGWSCSIDTFINQELSPKERKALRKSLAKRDNFVEYIIKPILDMHRVCGVLPREKKRVDKVNEILSEKIPGWSGRRLLGPNEDPSVIEPRKLLKKAMMAWLPAADALVDMIAMHVPSPVMAQRMRAPLLYSGDLDDTSGQGIYHCDASGPAVVYISKMAPSGLNSKRMLGFGRVFSGTIRPGDTLRALRTDGHEMKAKISQIKICGINGRMLSIQSAEAGQLIALDGIDEVLNKAGTLTSSLEGLAIRHMNFSVTPVVQHSVKPEDRRNLTKMVMEMQQVVSADSTALFYKDQETQEYILAGAGELHIEVLVSSFVQKSGIEVELSEPIIAYRETVLAASEEAAMAKSDNKHNKVYIKASPLADDVLEAMGGGDLVGLDPKTLGKALVKNFGWNSNDASRIWAIGPEPLSREDQMSAVDRPTSILVDSTFGLQIPDDAKSNIIEAFKHVTRQGVLVNAPLRGVRFDLVDAKFHSDSVHRRPNSVVPAASRAMRGAFLMAKPALMEPTYRVDVTGPANMLNGAYAVLGQRGGIIVDATSTTTSDTIEASVPVRRAFGLAGELRLETQGQAHCSTMFDGMRLVSALVQDEIVAETRSRKNLPEEIPTAATFISL